MAAPPPPQHTHTHVLQALDDIMMATLFYEFGTFCTSIVAETEDGKILHARNQDCKFERPPSLTQRCKSGGALAVSPFDAVKRRTRVCSG